MVLVKKTLEKNSEQTFKLKNTEKNQNNIFGPKIP